MIDNSSSMPITFRFASSELHTLDQNQIDKIPYLSALASSADKFELARDEEGYLKVDPCINYNDFIFIVESLSFTRISQLFIRLPKEMNVMPIISLWNFLGLDSQYTPTLRKVDSTFFSSVNYNPLREVYERIIDISTMQDMAVQFAIAIFKEEYDFRNNEVIDHIYWLAMFILSTSKWFEAHLRYHVCTIIENCFILFKPSQLRSLKRLKEKMNCDVKKDFKASNSTYDTYKYLEHLTWFDRICFFDLFYDDQLYFADDIIWSWEHLSETTLLKSVSNEVFKIIYGRLQGQICRSAIGALRTKRRTKQNGSSLQITEYAALPHALHSLFDSQRTQQKIRESILRELSILKPRYEQNLKILQGGLKLYESIRNSETQNDINFIRLLLHNHSSSYESLQEETLSCMTVLDKLDDSLDSIIEQIYERVLTFLYNAALKQFNQWSLTQLEIDQLRQSLTSECPPDNLSAILSKKTSKNYGKIVPKHQFKYLK